MSLAFCLLFHFSRALSWLSKTNFSYLLVVVLCFYTHGVVQCRLRSVLLRRLRCFAVTGDVLATRLAPSSPLLAPGPQGGPLGDRPFFKPTVVRLFFKDVLNEITTFSIPRRLVLGLFFKEFYVRLGLKIEQNGA